MNPDRRLRFDLSQRLTQRTEEFANEFFQMSSFTKVIHQAATGGLAELRPSTRMSYPYPPPGAPGTFPGPS